MEHLAGAPARKWLAFIASLWAQVRMAFAVGLPGDDDSRPASAPGPAHDPRAAGRPVRSLDDYAGYLTRNGLGSLDVGGGGSRTSE